MRHSHLEITKIGKLQNLNLIWNTHHIEHIQNSKPELDGNSLIHHVNFVISNLPISNERLEQFKEETRKDPILQSLIKYTTESWPEKT